MYSIYLTLIIILLIATLSIYFLLFGEDIKHFIERKLYQIKWLFIFIYSALKIEYLTILLIVKNKDQPILKRIKAYFLMRKQMKKIQKSGREKI
jgi:hypothetical protein